MSKNSIRIVTTRTLAFCLAVIALPLAAIAQPSPSSRGKRFGWQIGVGNPNAAAPNSMSFKDFVLPSSIYHTEAYSTDINPSGIVCGYFVDANGEINGVVGTGVNYTVLPGVTPSGIADDGTVAGNENTGGSFIYKNGETIMLPNTTYRSINQQGTILYYDHFEMKDYTWKDGVSTLVSYPTPPEGVVSIGGWDLNSSGDMLVFLGYTDRSDLVLLKNGAYVPLPPLPVAPSATYGGLNTATLLDNGAILLTVIETLIDSTGTSFTALYKAYILQQGTYTRLYAPADPTGLYSMTATNGSIGAYGLPFIAGVYFSSASGTFKSYLAGPRDANF
jgi:hypothetical protein